MDTGHLPDNCLTPSPEQRMLEFINGVRPQRGISRIRKVPRTLFDTPNTTPRNPRVLDLIQVAAILDAHPKTIRLMAQAGKIPGFRVGRLWRFSAVRIYDWIDHSQAA